MPSSARSTTSTPTSTRCGRSSFPAGVWQAAQLHVARTVVRRAERATWVALAEHSASMNPLTAKYLNRVSDLLFVLARYVNREQGDVLWVPGRQPLTSCDREDATRLRGLARRRGLEPGQKAGQGVGTHRELDELVVMAALHDDRSGEQGEHLGANRGPALQDLEVAPGEHLAAGARHS